MFRQEPQPPVKGKNLDDGCHAPRLRGHVVFCQPPRTSDAPVFLALLPINSKRSGTRSHRPTSTRCGMSIKTSRRWWWLEPSYGRPSFTQLIACSVEARSPSSCLVRSSLSILPNAGPGETPSFLSCSPSSKGLGLN